MTIRADLLRDEGVRLKPYTDTAAKITIGVGRNLTDVGITQSEAEAMLDGDIRTAEAELDRAAAWWRNMPEPAQRGICNMQYNLGWPRLSQFSNMLAALATGRYNDAADHALDSAWARQVGARATRIAELFRSCQPKE